MAITRVQGLASSTGSNVTSFASTLTSGIKQNNLIIAAVATGNNTATFIPPDAGWKLAAFNQPAGASATIGTAIWYLVVDSQHAGQTTFTWGLSAAHSVFVCMEEWSATYGWYDAPLDAVALGDTIAVPVAATVIDSGTATPTSQAEELWVAALAYKGTAQAETSVTAGWTSDVEATQATLNTETLLYQVTSTRGTPDCNYTIGTAAFWSGCVATFRTRQEANWTLGPRWHRPRYVQRGMVRSIFTPFQAISAWVLRAIGGRFVGQTSPVNVPRYVRRAFGSTLINYVLGMALRLRLGRIRDVGFRLNLKNVSRYTDAVLADSPIAYYHLDEVSGQIARDQSGHGYDAAMTSGIAHGQAGANVNDPDPATLFAAPDYLILPSNLTLSRPSTLEYWKRVSNGYHYIVITVDASGTRVYLDNKLYTRDLTYVPRSLQSTLLNLIKPGAEDYRPRGLTSTLVDAFDTTYVDTGLAYAGSLQQGNLDEVSVYNYVLTPQQMFTHWLAAVRSQDTALRLSLGIVKDALLRLRLGKLQDVGLRFILSAGATNLKDLALRLRLGLPKDTVLRLRLGILKDVVLRFRLKSADQLKGVVLRLRLGYLKDSALRLRLGILKDVALRFRLRSTDQLKNVALRLGLGKLEDLPLRLRLGILKDAALRLRLKSADQLKDLALRLRLGKLKDVTLRLSLGVLKDTALRLRLRSVDQLRGLALRLRLGSLRDSVLRLILGKLKDATLRFRLKSADQLKDVSLRLLLGSLRNLSLRLRLGVLKDVTLRLRLRSADQLRDLALRLRLGKLKDVSLRFLLTTAQTFKDLSFRFRLRSADQLRDTILRLRLGGLRDSVLRLRLGKLKDAAIRFRLHSADQLKDLSLRFNVGKLKDAALRLRLGSLKDVGLRLRLRSANLLRDCTLRFKVGRLDDCILRFVLGGIQAGPPAFATEVVTSRLTASIWTFLSALTSSPKASSRYYATHSDIMPTPFTSILSTITLTDVNNTLVSNATPVTLVVNYPDGTTASLALGTGITNLGSGQYQAAYNTKGTGSIRELWSVTVPGGNIAQFQFIVETGY